MKKAKITHEAQLDWEYMARKNNIVFDEVIAACADKRIKHLMVSSTVGTRKLSLSSMPQSSLDTMMVRGQCSR